MLNKAQIMGRLGADPEVRTFANGNKVCNLSVATSEQWKDRNTGEKRERTEWHKVSIFNEPLIRVAEQHLRKGARVYLEGKIETRKWQDQSGQDRYTTEIALRPYTGSLTVIDWPNSAGGGSGGSGAGGSGGYAGGAGGTGINDPAQQGPGRYNDDDDEIPF